MSETGARPAGGSPVRAGVPVWFVLLAAGTVGLGGAAYWLSGDAALWAANLAWTAAALVALLGLGRGGSPERLMLMVAVGCWLAGQVIWDAYALSGVVPGVPSPADAFWLAFAVIALWTFSRGPGEDRAGRTLVYIDLTAIVVACGALAGVLLYDAAGRSELDGLARVVAIAYPALYGAVAVKLALRLAQAGLRTPGSLLILGGLALEAIAFSLWAPLLLGGTYVTGQAPIDILWTLGLVLIGYGGLILGPAPAGGLAATSAQRERLAMRAGIVAGLAFAVLLLLIPVLSLQDQPLGQRLIAQIGAIVLGIVFALRFTLLSIRHLRLAEEQQRAREEVERSASELDSFFATAPEMLCVVGTDGYFKRISPYCERVLGYSVEEMLARPFIDFVHPEDREATTAEVVRILSGDQLASFDNRYRCRDGSYASLHWVTILGPEGDLIYAAAADVTEQKRVEAEREEARLDAERANRAKSEFLSRMSHELRTPLNAILGFGQLLEMEDLQGTAAESVDHMLRGGRHLLALIDEVLDISRIESGKMTLSVEPVGLAAAISEVEALMRPLADQHGVSLTVGQPPGHDLFVLGDRQRLRQILLNLLSNAVKYNREEGTVRLDHAVVPGDNGSAPRVQISVSDTGPGLTPEQCDRLFEPFDRLGAEGTAVEGTGLGLALSERLAVLMGGSITVDSRLGTGSTFVVELSSAPSVAEPAALETAPRAGPAGRALEGEHTLLYIEDNPANLRLVEQIFASRPGISLLPAMLGRLGIELAQQHRPDLILLDVHLPDITGAEALRHLKADAATSHIPVVVLSADATARQMERLLDGGAVDYLTKPLDVARFLDVVEATLESAA